MQQDKKQYGLIKLSKTKSANNFLQKSFVFDDSDDGSDSDSETVPQYQSSNLRKQAQTQINKAIECDPTIFQYDEVYDDMKSSTQPKAAPKKTEAKPRYIANLLRTAEIRKREQEIRTERKIQKERELEGDEFKDKEAFVTSAYKEKLEEMKKTEAEAKRQEKIENILDVTKQNDLSGFYRSLYKNSMFNQEEEEESAETFLPEPSTSKDTGKFKTTNRKKGNLRERVIDEEESSEEENIPADNEVASNEDNKDDKTEAKIDTKTEESPGNVTEKPSNEESKKEKPNESSEELPAVEATVEPKPKIERSELIRKIFTKRTIGEVFEEARKRYLIRKGLLTV